MQVLLPRSAKASSLIAGTALLLLTSPAIAGNDPTPNPGDTTNGVEVAHNPANETDTLKKQRLEGTTNHKS